jgi:hypothetical protein
MLVSRRKIDAMNASISAAIKAKNAILVAHTARALLEHVAMQAEISSSLVSFANALHGQSDPTKISEAIRRAAAFLHRCYFGRSPKIENEKKDQAIHISECLRALEKELPGAAADYDFLCELVHPNHGSNLLVSTLEAGERIKSVVADFSSPEIQRMARICTSLLETTEGVELRISSYVGKLGMFGNRFLLPNAKISNVFAERVLVPEGDGKSRETAYRFPTARDPMEAISAFYQFCERQRVLVLGRINGGADEGGVYDAYTTSRGTVWCKVKYASFCEDADGQEDAGEPEP